MNGGKNLKFNKHKKFIITYKKIFNRKFKSIETQYAILKIFMNYTENKNNNFIYKLGNKYSKSSKIFLVIAFLFLIWILFVALGSFVLEQGPYWSILNLENWIYIWCGLTLIFIILELGFYFHYSSKQSIDHKEIVYQPELMHGKRLHIYTHPEDAKGGIFSKTYIPIDEDNVLYLREQMISSDELWPIKKEK